MNLSLVRRKKYKIRRVGKRGAVVGIPQSFLDRYDLDLGDECVSTEDEHGNLVFVFPHSVDWATANDKIDS
jgi:hypothetical protein